MTIETHPDGRHRYVCSCGRHPGAWVLKRSRAEQSWRKHAEAVKREARRKQQHADEIAEARAAAVNLVVGGGEGAIEEHW
ncbi:MAG TPA: hypothetical protein VFQ42_21840 [Mycobacterium sp.]|nr:hypothetical protein [Mycobacterium sp.]